MDCTKCGAPLPAKSNLCRYCSTLNDRDLRAVPGRVRTGAETGRACPRCSEPMPSVQLGVGGGIVLERCERCHGIFFDPEELERLLEGSVARPEAVDHERMNRIVDEEANPEIAVRAYVPCPDCGKLMNRRNYGARSCVVLDRCREHGVWLDGGELAQLLKWARAGGLEHKSRRETEAKKMAERAAAQRYIRPEEKFSGQTTLAPARESEDSLLVEVLGFVLSKWL